jgi:hypothetical protein
MVRGTVDRYRGGRPLAICSETDPEAV